MRLVNDDLSCTQGFGAVAVLNLAVMSGNVGGVCLILLYQFPLFF